MGRVARDLRRLLLLAYPSSFRERFGDDALRQLEGDLVDAREGRRPKALARVALLHVDFLAAGLLERASAMRSRAPLGTAVRRGWARDVRLALRRFRRRPGYFVVSVATLGLGVSASVALLDVALATLHPRLPVSSPDRLVALFQHTDEGGYHSSFSLPTWQDYGRSMSTLSGLAAFVDVPLNLFLPGGGERVRGQLVSPDYFDVLGVDLLVGPGWRQDDGAAGRSAGVVLAHALWQREFGGRRDVLGTDVRVNGTPFTVVGVAPPSFRGLQLDASIDVWAPLAAREPLTGYPEEWTQGRGMHWLSLVGRMGPGATRDRVAAEASAVAAGLAEAYPEGQGGWTVRVVPAAESLIWPDSRPQLAEVTTMLAVVVVLILLLACVNVASMGLASSLARRGETAVRVALGAGTAHLVREEVVAATLVTLPAGALGLAVGAWVDRGAAAARISPLVPAGLDVAPDVRTLLAVAASLPLMAFLVGVLPAYQVSRARRSHVTGRDTPSSGLVRLRSALSSLQIAASVAVLASAGLLVRSARARLGHDLGFDPRGVVLATVDPALSGYASDRGVELYRRALDALADLPGVEAASAAAHVPLVGRRFGTDLRLEEGGEPLNVTGNVVAPGYFRAMGTRLVAGRDLTYGEASEGPTPLVLNETAAASLWPGRSPLGEEVLLHESLGERGVVVGVAADFGAGRTLFATARPAAFLPLAGAYASPVTFHVRARDGDAGALLPRVRQALAGVDDQVPVYDLTTLAARVDAASAPSVTTATAVSLLGVVGLLLAGLGVYGIVAQGVARRRREFGIRIAIGARKTHVWRQVTAESAVLVGAGLALGVPLAMATTGLLRTSLFGVPPRDLTALVAAIVTVCAATTIAVWVPARRATRVDPAVALRTD